MVAQYLREAERVPDQMDHAGLHDRQLPHGVDRLAQPFQAIADHDAHIGGAAVLISVSTCSQNFAHTAVAGPQPQNVALAGHGDSNDHVDRPIAD
jgi:hypothetical protein